MTSCYSAVKFLFYILNTIFTLLGLVIAALGIFFLICKDDLPIQFPSWFFIGIAVVGMVIFILGLSGFLGAAKGSNCMLITYSVILLLLAVAKIALIILIFINKGKVKEFATKLVNVPLEHHAEVRENPAFHLFEFMGQCCGTTGPASYFNGTVPNHAKVISSCCPFGFSKPEVTCDYENAHTTGCLTETASDNAMGTLNNVAYSVIIVAVLEIMALFSALFLSCSHKSSDGYYEYD